MYSNYTTTFTDADKSYFFFFVGICNELTAFTLIQFVDTMNITARLRMEEHFPLTEPDFYFIVHRWIDRCIYPKIILTSFAN